MAPKAAEEAAAVQAAAALEAVAADKVERVSAGVDLVRVSSRALKAAGVLTEAAMPQEIMVRKATELAAMEEAVGSTEVEAAAGKKADAEELGGGGGGGGTEGERRNRRRRRN